MMANVYPPVDFYFRFSPKNFGVIKWCKNKQEGGLADFIETKNITIHLLNKKMASEMKIKDKISKDYGTKF